MSDQNQNNENFRQIEDIIDARKLLGQYNVHKQSTGVNFRYIYSSPTGTASKSVPVDDTTVTNDLDVNTNLKQTDSEITVVRVRYCDDINIKSRRNKWDMHDIAIPGDGSHLGESPSLVNLATLVGHNVPCEGEEYLVPLSSWDPYLKAEDLRSDLKCCSERTLTFDCTTNSHIKPENDTSVSLENGTSEQEILVLPKRSWAGRISKFILYALTIQLRRVYITQLTEMDQFYKDYHSKNMHSNGTTAYETFIAILPSYFITMITVMLESVLCTYITGGWKWQFIIEYTILISPVLVSITVLSKYLESIILTLFIIAVHFVLLIYNIRPSKFIVSQKDVCNTSFLTNSRSTINILSVMAILAVDFNIFPRYFAKTDTFGYSLMDVGVGLFMYSNGIVAHETKGQKNSLIKSITSSIPLFILGIARCIFVKQTDYVVPVSEYGVHWNFFITLGITKIVCSLILTIIKTKYIVVAATSLIVLHEMLLQLVLQKFALANSKRDNFIVANKEGIVSICGYVSIYLFSVYFGYCLHARSRAGNKISTVFLFITHSLLALVTSLTLKNYFGVSRKLANSAYCLWILFIGIFMTGLYYLAQILLESLYKGKLQGLHSPLIFQAVNYNGLIFFLVGNLLTGLINITFETLTLSHWVSLIMLLSYMFINCLIVMLLYHTKYKFKF
ncbi:hypothetical protein NQ315_014103 [Exocentrus adspersus]|uniref:Phosphatidylinositol-glycan biosynthesis class W protein n=1 Tax=Exocentrus adspersus TaxID=1586481 RepID=A0AAV8VVC3_9CUCU|nr:hypothetical protein NQ315_014103 [Exocentrus adspersus]